MQIVLLFLFINFSLGEVNNPFPRAKRILNDTITQKTLDSTELKRQRELRRNAGWDNRVFTKVQNEATFPGGSSEWNNYIKQEIVKHIKELTDDGNSGTCRVRFIVSSDGSISNVEALSMKGTKLEQVAVNAIRKGPKWNPGTQNGRAVNAYREQPVTFTIGNK